MIDPFPPVLLLWEAQTEYFQPLVTFVSVHPEIGEV